MAHTIGLSLGPLKELDVYTSPIRVIREAVGARGYVKESAILQDLLLHIVYNYSPVKKALKSP
jgi:hypothetical protein